MCTFLVYSILMIVKNVVKIIYDSEHQFALQIKGFLYVDEGNEVRWMGDANNIILFPTLRKSLEKTEREAYEAMKKQDYESALEKFDFLLFHQYASHEIYISKLISLLKLHELDEAEYFCESLLANDEDLYYFDYFEYYIMILYERNKFSVVMECIDAEEKSNRVPKDSKKKLRDLYRLAYQMNAARAEELISELNEAFRENNSRKQWYILNKWKELKADPPEQFLSVLKKPTVHPAIKTSIIEILIDNNIDAEIEIEKFGELISLNLKHLLKLDEHPIYTKLLHQIGNIEQENPTLFLQVNEMLRQYSYIHYPKMYADEEAKRIAEALIHVGKENLALPLEDGEKKSNLENQIENIRLSNELYLHICLD